MSKQMDKSRQQFEEEYKKQFLYSPNGVMDAVIKNASWNFWQASRKSLEIELPKLAANTTSYECGYLSAINDCEYILLSNGVKIKNE